MNLTEKDIEKLEKISEYTKNGTSTTLHKKEVLDALESILRPKCSVCRKDLDENFVVNNQRKMHKKCEKRYLNK